MALLPEARNSGERSINVSDGDSDDEVGFHVSLTGTLKLTSSGKLPPSANQRKSASFNLWDKWTTFENVRRLFLLNHAPNVSSGSCRKQWSLRVTSLYACSFLIWVEELEKTLTDAHPWLQSFLTCLFSTVNLIVLWLLMLIPDWFVCPPAAEDSPQPVLSLHPLWSLLWLPHRCLHHHRVPTHMWVMKEIYSDNFQSWRSVCPCFSPDVE